MSQQIVKTGTRILIIDDELGIREGCRRVLEPQGYTFDMAKNFQDGVKHIKQNDYDMVLLDVMLPDGRGIDLLTPILERDPNTIPVIITGYATIELAIEAIKRGAYDFIAKPFNAEVLTLTVQQGLEKRKLSIEAKRLAAIEQEALELARAKEEMERLDRLKTTFLLTVAHELRSPVAGAQSLLRTLLRGLAGQLNDQQNDILNRIEDRLDFLMELIDDLLSLASSKTFDAEAPLEKVTLQPIIRRVAERLEIHAESKNVNLILAIPEEDIVVDASEEGVERIFSNLIGNAVKYTPAGGKVEVGVENAPSGVKISVVDTGIGIPKEDLSHLGEEFFRAKNARKSGVKGTGLGLNIVKQYVDQFGWQIEVQSAEGEGSVFTISLPPDSANK
jgi:signal transduction histidine kinase